MERSHRNALANGYRLHWYQIDSVLGQGGFGITYLAHDTNLDQPVAIKEFLPQELAVREQDSSVHPVTDGHADTFDWGLSRFLTEARTLAKFRHPNIVLVHSVFEANNTAYMVMEYEQGRSLDDALKFRKVEGEAALKAMVWPLLEGLELMHEAGFIHRDIKPGNIYIRADDTPVLLDFGSARLALGGQTRTLTTLVSPGYAPFEQYETGSDGGRQGPWTDLYSLAATLYMAVLGHGPPDAVTRANARLEGRPDPLIPSRIAAPPGYTPAFLHAIDAALAFQAADRPKNVAQWRNMLRAEEAPDEDDERTVVPGASAAPATSPSDTQARFAGADTGEAFQEASSRGSGARRRSPPAPAATPPPRRRVLVAALSMVVIAALAGGGWYASTQFYADDSQRETPPANTAATAEPAPAGDADRPSARTEAAPEQMQQNAATPPAPASAGLSAGETSRVGALLAAAESDLGAGRLVEPVDASAVYRYYDVLDLQPDNSAALAGLRRIVATLAAQASDDLARGGLDEAERRLRQAEAVDPQSPEVIRLRARLEDTRAAASAERLRAENEARLAAEAEAEARRAAEAQAKREAEAQARAAREAAAVAQRAAEERARQAEAEAEAAASSPAARVRALLAAAARDVAATRLTSPAGDNAFEKYREVERLEPGNGEANAGRQRIVERYIELADAAAGAGRYTQAEGYLRRAETVTPGSEQVDAARAALAAAAAPAPEAQVAARSEPAPESDPELSPEPAPPAEPVASQPTPVQPEAPPAPLLRNPAQVAIAPVETKRNCFYSDDLTVRDAVLAKLRETPGLRLIFNAYADSGRAALRKQVWEGSRSERVPSAAGVRNLATSADADVVFMAFIDCGHTENANTSRFPFKLWAMDMDTGEIAVQEGRLSNVSDGVNALLDFVVASRRGAAAR